MKKAPVEIINQALSDRDMFSYMEQIEIACKLFSKYLFSPFSLSIQDGFTEPSLSSEEMIKIVFDKKRNPYFEFLEQDVFPVLENIQFKMCWING